MTTSRWRTSSRTTWIAACLALSGCAGQAALRSAEELDLTVLSIDEQIFTRHVVIVSRAPDGRRLMLLSEKPSKSAWDSLANDLESLEIDSTYRMRLRRADSVPGLTIVPRGARAYKLDGMVIWENDHLTVDAYVAEGLLGRYRRRTAAR